MEIQLYTSFLIFFSGVFGLFMGSFLGVLIDRLPNNETVLFGRSHCDFCKKDLAWYDLVPLLSYVFLGGRCRYCHRKLSIFYPTIEVVTGILFALTAWLVLNNDMYMVFSMLYLAKIFFYLFITASLIVIFFTDLKYTIIPFAVLLPATVITLMYYILYTKYEILPYLLSGFGAFIFFFLLFLVTKGRGMGFGDVVYVLFMGFLLGFPGIIVGLYTAFLTGAAVSLILIVAKKKKLRGSTIPFGPFLVIGTYAGLFFTPYILQIISALFLV